ncbi:glutamate 5-kinase [Streptomyces sp. TRM66268-LWL]|uniref:Glutamate 5-kinase n=1 Tax=Streptomyces polyasparticus TaxID=2767826 RepID=A0ABR7SXZ5_9ACTN|nr:glutamate 5-kinase [Streptomyces polyasparticus]MBC9719426.1 glutamate 5-kinase [Streptomyces polyasparticus]
MRTTVATARQIVVKVGTSCLAAEGSGLSVDRINTLVDVLAVRRAQPETQVTLVSSGAVAAGLAHLDIACPFDDAALMRRAAAGIGQGMLVSCYAAAFSRYSQTVGQVLLTADEVIHRADETRRVLTQLLSRDVVPVVNENDTGAARDQRFGDNDSLAAHLAILLRADVLILLSDVDALYDAPPSTPGASPVWSVHPSTQLPLSEGYASGSADTGLGTGGITSKVKAACAAAAAGIPVVLTSAKLAEGALSGDEVGTYFHPAPF